MQHDVEAVGCPPLKPSRRLALRWFGVVALATVMATVLGVASPGRISAARVNVAPAASIHRTQPATAHSAAWSDPSAADVFMQAIMVHNGQLAWQQLCPALQAHVSVSALSNLMKSNEATNQDVQFQLDSVGSHVWADGGAIHVYVVTAHWPSAPDARMLFVLRTQASGCIDGMLNA